MNIHTPDIDLQPSREEAAAALAVLRRWLSRDAAAHACVAVMAAIVGAAESDLGAVAVGGGAIPGAAVMDRAGGGALRRVARARPDRPGPCAPRCSGAR